MFQIGTAVLSVDRLVKGRDQDRKMEEEEECNRDITDCP